MSSDICVVPVSAFEDRRLSGAALRVLGMLCNYANKDGECFPSQSTVAERLGLSRQTVNYHIKILCEMGYLKAERRSNENGGETSCTYRIMRPVSTPPVNPTSTPPVEPTSTPPVDPVSTPSVDATSTPPVDPVSTPPVEPVSTPSVDATSSPSVDPVSTPPVDATSSLTINLTNQLTDQLTNQVETEEEHEIIASPSEEPPTENEHGVSDTQDGRDFLPVNHSWMGANPETMPKDKQKFYIQVYKRVTGKLPLAASGDAITEAIRRISGVYPSEEAMVEYLNPLWERWKKYKHKDGRPYSLFNLTWLTEWAVIELNKQGNENQLPAHQTRTIPAALATQGECDHGKD